MRAIMFTGMMADKINFIISAEYDDHPADVAERAMEGGFACANIGDVIWFCEKEDTRFVVLSAELIEDHVCTEPDDFPESESELLQP